MVRRVLKDNKVPGTSAGTRATEATGWGAGSAAGFLGESQVGLCDRPGACLDGAGAGGLNKRNFSKRKRENRGTQQLSRELSAAAKWPLAPPSSQPLDCERQTSSPSTHLKPDWCTPRSATRCLGAQVQSTGSVCTPIRGLGAHT